MINTLNGIISTFFIKCSSILTVGIYIFNFFFNSMKFMIALYLQPMMDIISKLIITYVDSIDKIKKVASFSSTEIVTLVILKD